VGHLGGDGPVETSPRWWGRGLLSVELGWGRDSPLSMDTGHLLKKVPTETFDPRERPEASVGFRTTRKF